MIQTSISGYYTSKNEFRIKEIYVSRDNVMYTLKRDESFFPHEYVGSVKDLYDSVKNNFYPNFCMAEPRQYNDDDPKSLATFFMNKLQSFDLSEAGAEKRLYDLLAGFGEDLE